MKLVFCRMAQLRGHFAPACLSASLEIAKLARKHRGTDNHLNGLEKCYTSLRRYSVSAAILAYLYESASAPLMEDARLLRHIGDIEAIIAAHVGCIHGMSPLVWQRLALLIVRTIVQRAVMENESFAQRGHCHGRWLWVILQRISPVYLPMTLRRTQTAR